MTGQCRDCRAPILFVQLNTGSRIPVDPIPTDAGNVAAHRPQPGASLVGHVIARDYPAGPADQVYMPHKATCHVAPKVARRERPPSLFDGPFDNPNTDPNLLPPPF